jgi:hypothetical protein
LRVRSAPRLRQDKPKRAANEQGKAHKKATAACHAGDTRLRISRRHRLGVN